VIGTLHLLDAMRTTGVDRIVFSSSAAVYGEPASVPIDEDSALVPTNVYGEPRWSSRESCMITWGHMGCVRFPCDISTPLEPIPMVGLARTMIRKHI